MSIITFWNDNKEQTGQTLSVAAIATHMAIEHNYKTLIISTGFHDETLTKCFWQKNKVAKKNLGLFGPNANVGLDEGFNGLSKLMVVNRVTPESIRNYTKAVFADRLELLRSNIEDEKEYQESQNLFIEIMKIANQCYDLVFVDLDKRLKDEHKEKILEISNLIIACIGQKQTSIDSFMEQREEKPILKSKKSLILIGRYDKYSKYNVKNISRYMREKNRVMTIPYNTLFFEASDEAGVVDLFLRLRKVDPEDRNAIFVDEVKRASDSVIYRLENLKAKM